MSPILLIEHNLNIRHMINLNMTIRGYELTEAATLGEAVCLLDQQINPYLIILDLLPPDKSGLGFLDMLNKDARYLTIPVLVITVMTSKEIGHQLDNYATIVGVLEKPFIIPSLLSSIESVGMVPSVSASGIRSNVFI